MSDLTCLSYWFPKIEAAGLPVPKTILLTMPKEAQESIWAAFDGKNAGDPKPFFAAIERAAETFGYPCFLRTGLTSNKHDWKKTCFLGSPTEIPNHVFALAEFSEIGDFMGMPWDVWAVREMLPTKPFGFCGLYGNMPICREFRFFVDDDIVRCWHPYWPLHALEDGEPQYDRPFDYAEFCTPDDEGALRALAARAGKAVGGSWSVDILETARGWYVTDMAEANKSFHWPDCPNAEKRP